MDELKVGQFLCGERGGLNVAGSIVKVNKTTYSVLMDDGYRIQVCKKTLAIDQTIFYPIDPKEAFYKVYEVEAYKRKLIKLESELTRLHSILREISDHSLKICEMAGWENDI